MNKTLIIFSSHDGQTQKIAHYIEKEINESECQVIQLEDALNLELSEYDKILIGASIRYGHYSKQLYRFIEKNHPILTDKNAAFYSVNLTARKEGKDTPEGSSYVQKFLTKSAWQPQLIGVFAGALYYPRYRFIDRVMIRFIMSITGGETDTTKEVEYTNWEKVGKFSRDFKDM